MNVTLRCKEPNDEQLIRSIHHDAYREVVVRQFETWDETQQDIFFDAKWASCKLKVILIDNVVCGFTTVEDCETEIRLDELVIAPDSQGQGVGTEIIKQLIERSNKRKVPVKLRVLKENRAIALYQKLGFAECGTTETHVLMQYRTRQ